MTSSREVLYSLLLLTQQLLLLLLRPSVSRGAGRPPPPPALTAGYGLGGTFSVMTQSVVSTSPATEAEFCREFSTTFAESRMPDTHPPPTNASNRKQGGQASRQAGMRPRCLCFFLTGLRQVLELVGGSVEPEAPLVRTEHLATPAPPPRTKATSAPPRPEGEEGSQQVGGRWVGGWGLTPPSPSAALPPGSPRRSTRSASRALAAPPTTTATAARRRQQQGTSVSSSSREPSQPARRQQPCHRYGRGGRTMALRTISAPMRSSLSVNAASTSSRMLWDR